MGKVVADMSMSLDGFIADPSDGVEHLFGWFDNGDVTTPSASPKWSFHTTQTSALHLRDALATAGALIVGRRLYEVAQAWGGTHPIGVPIVVVTHTPPDSWPHGGTPFTFVTDGIESAVAQAKAIAGDKNVGVASATIAQQCLNAGLLDAISVSLVPVLLGSGIRFFDHLTAAPTELENPRVLQGDRVTHLYYHIKPR